MMHPKAGPSALLEKAAQVLGLSVATGEAILAEGPGGGGLPDFYLGGCLVPVTHDHTSLLS